MTLPTSPRPVAMLAGGGVMKAHRSGGRTSSLDRGGGSLPFERMCELQGLPADYLSESPFTASGKRQAVGNGVPLPMGRAVAKAVLAALADGLAQRPCTAVDAARRTPNNPSEDGQ